MRSKTKGNLILILVAMMWGSGFISQKFGNMAMPPMTFNAIRQLMSGLVLTPLVMHSLSKSAYMSKDANTEEELRSKRSRLLKGGALCGIFLLLGTMTQQVGLLTVSAGKSGFITSLYIVIVPLLSAAIGSKVSKKAVFCVVIALAGYAIMSLRGGLGGATRGDWLTLFAAAAFAAQIVSISRFVDEGNAVMLSRMQFFLSGAVGLIIAIIVEQPALSEILDGVGPLIYQALVPGAGGYTLQMVGQRYTESTTAALIMSTEAVFATLFGALVLGELMSGMEMLGAAIIFSAVILGQVDPKRMN